MKLSLRENSRLTGRELTGFTGLIHWLENPVISVVLTLVSNTVVTTVLPCGYFFGQLAIV